MPKIYSIQHLFHPFLETDHWFLRWYACESAKVKMFIRFYLLRHESRLRLKISKNMRKNKIGLYFTKAIKTDYLKKKKKKCKVLKVKGQVLIFFVSLTYSWVSGKFSRWSISLEIPLPRAFQQINLDVLFKISSKAENIHCEYSI